MDFDDRLDSILENFDKQDVPIGTMVKLFDDRIGKIEQKRQIGPRISYRIKFCTIEGNKLIWQNPGNVSALDIAEIITLPRMIEVY